MVKGQRLSRLCVVGLLLVLIFAAIRYVGGYLVQQMSQFDEVAPSIEEMAPPVAKRLVVRLEPVSYYSMALGSFADVATGQAVIDTLANAGYRVYIKQGPPYKLFVGCFARNDAQMVIPEEIQAAGQDVYVVENLLNEVSLKFNENDPLMQQKIAPLVGQYDVVLQHSLKMFQTPFYAQYTDVLWQQMLEQLMGELETLAQANSDVLADQSSQPVAKALIDLSDVTQNYHKALQSVVEKKNDKAVFLAQSYLLQMIDCYHVFMTLANQINEKS